MLHSQAGDTTAVRNPRHVSAPPTSLCAWPHPLLGEREILQVSLFSPAPPPATCTVGVSALARGVQIRRVRPHLCSAEALSERPSILSQARREKDNLRFRTSWAGRLDIPLATVVALTHLPGWRPVFHDDLAGKRSGWTVQGGPGTGEGVILNRPGQSLTHRLVKPIASGRIGVTHSTLSGGVSRASSARPRAAQAASAPSQTA